MSDDNDSIKAELEAIRDQLALDVRNELLHFLRNCRMKLAEVELNASMGEHIKGLAEVLHASGVYRKGPPEKT
jgi:hypothetical protein